MPNREQLAAQAALDLQTALAARWPKTTFAVETEQALAYILIRVDWTDGPTWDAVREVTHLHRMEKTVITEARKMSAEFLREIGAIIAVKHGLDPERLVQISPDGIAHIPRHVAVPAGIDEEIRTRAFHTAREE